MEINEIISQLKDKFGDKIDVTKITETLKGVDTSKLSFTEIIDKVKDGIGDFDGDGKVESVFEEIKGKATSVFSNMFK